MNWNTEKVDFINKKYQNLETVECTIWQSQLLDQNLNPYGDIMYHVMVKEKEGYVTIGDGIILRKDSKDINYLEELLELYFKYNYGQNSI